VTLKKRGPGSHGGPGEPLQDVVDRLQGDVADLRGSRRRLVEAAHADRRALERALHDGVQQHLVALAADVQRLAGLVDRDPPAAKALLDEMAVNLRQALAQTMALAQEVYPPLLEGRGLATSLRSAAASAGVTINVDVSPGTDYPPEISTAVYWSCVEALSSASPGSEARVSVRHAAGALTFEVAVAGHLAEERLDLMRDRIEALAGRLSADDAQDGGSRVHGWLPLSR
jgi:signal transduction histidine kinase